MSRKLPSIVALICGLMVVPHATALVVGPGGQIHYGIGHSADQFEGLNGLQAGITVYPCDRNDFAPSGTWLAVGGTYYDQAQDREIVEWAQVGFKHEAEPSDCRVAEVFSQYCTDCAGPAASYSRVTEHATALPTSTGEGSGLSGRIKVVLEPAGTSNNPCRFEEFTLNCPLGIDVDEIMEYLCADGECESEDDSSPLALADAPCASLDPVSGDLECALTQAAWMLLVGEVPPPCTSHADVEPDPDVDEYTARPIVCGLVEVAKDITGECKNQFSIYYADMEAPVHVYPTKACYATGWDAYYELQGGFAIPEPDPSPGGLPGNIGALMTQGTDYQYAPLSTMGSGTGSNCDYYGVTIWHDSSNRVRDVDVGVGAGPSDANTCVEALEGDYDIPGPPAFMIGVMVILFAVARRRCN